MKSFLDFFSTFQKSPKVKSKKCHNIPRACFDSRFREVVLDQHIHNSITSMIHSQSSRCFARLKLCSVLHEDGLWGPLQAHWRWMATPACSTLDSSKCGEIVGILGPHEGGAWGAQFSPVSLRNTSHPTKMQKDKINPNIYCMFPEYFPVNFMLSHVFYMICVCCFLPLKIPEDLEEFSSHWTPAVFSPKIPRQMPK